MIYMNRKLYIVSLLVLFLSTFINSVWGSFQPLQVSVLINGYSIPAIIDTGAEITVMSLSCAKRCQLANAIDTRHSGTAVGVGVTDIVGRIDDLEMKLGETVSISNKISVLRQSRCDFILGLDILQKHDCDISFKDNRLQLTLKNKTVKIPLLSPKSASFEPEEIAASPIRQRQHPQQQQVPQQRMMRRAKTIAMVEETEEEEEEQEDSMTETEMGDEEPISMAGI